MEAWRGLNFSDDHYICILVWVHLVTPYLVWAKDAHMGQQTWPTIVQTIFCHMVVTKSISEPLVVNWTPEHISVTHKSKHNPIDTACLWSWHCLGTRVTCACSLLKTRSEFCAASDDPVWRHECTARHKNEHTPSERYAWKTCEHCRIKSQCSLNLFGCIQWCVLHFRWR